jgi:DNA polymerase III subunit delta'
MSSLQTLAGTESQPHAAAVLGPALPPLGEPSHAYLFHGPPGSGKRAAARAFAARLLGAGQSAPSISSQTAGDGIAQRVARGTHPDLTWVRPTGAAEMLVGDIDEPVVAAATKTPFESTRRVFVIEGADAMNDRAANRLLKTLEEPPAFAHLILLAGRREDVLATIVSRCQQVRFDPLAPRAIARLLLQEAEQPLEPERASACARLALGDVELARRLASAEGEMLRAAARELVSAALQRDSPVAPQPFSALLKAAGSAGASAGEQVSVAVQAELELLPGKERRKREREGVDAARRAERRQRTRMLDVGLRLVELWLRDMLCLAERAPELVHGSDALEQLRSDLAGLEEHGDPSGLPAAIAEVTQTRLSLSQNVTEELALQALCYRLQSELSA